MFIHFFCLCPLGLATKLNFNISKEAYFCSHSEDSGDSGIRAFQHSMFSKLPGIKGNNHQGYDVLIFRQVIIILSLLVTYEMYRE